MPIQSLVLLDYTGGGVCFALFLLAIYLLSLVINYTLVLDSDEATHFEMFGSKNNFQFGRRPLSEVRRKIQRMNQLKLEKEKKNNFFNK
uniref:Uncharacterized protein n=1 Tax=Strongyloides venezuelensis TaxID=75913 RepID=A0A0K0F0A3_STRVS